MSALYESNKLPHKLFVSMEQKPKNANNSNCQHAGLLLKPLYLLWWRGKIVSTHDLFEDDMK